MTAKEIHAILQQAHDQLALIFGKCEDDISTDTAFAIGEATGVLSKAKALIGRDIDAREQKS